MKRETLLTQGRRSYREWERLIDDWIFSDRDRQILKAFLLDKVGLSELAEKYHLADRTIQKIIYNGEAEIYKHI